MACEEKSRLIEQYIRAASDLSDALTTLHSKARSRCGPGEYQSREGIVAECETKLEQARAVFEEHTSRLGC
jgi:hypothetical protein